MFYTSTGYIISKDLKILINYGLVFHTTAATLPKKQIWRRIYASEFSKSGIIYDNFQGKEITQEN